MKKPVNEYTDEEIQSRLDFADRIISHLNGKSLAPHLDKERKDLLNEQIRRVTGVKGAGI